MADETRFQRAIRDTPGLRENKRRRAIQSLVGAACAVALLLIFGSPNDAGTEVLSWAGAIIGGVLIFYGTEFLWRYMEAPYALVREELAALRADVHHLPLVVSDEVTPDAAPTAQLWLGDMTPTAAVLICIGRGEAILAQQVVAIGNASKWTEETGAILAEKVSSVAAENFFASGMGAGSARDRIERGLTNLRFLHNAQKTQQR
jgi:hypothetical protein